MLFVRFLFKTERFAHIPSFLMSDVQCCGAGPTLTRLQFRLPKMSESLVFEGIARSLIFLQKTSN